MTYHIMCDPVHGIMEFNTDIKKIIQPLIDSIYFQRLRHIKQLSFVEYAYPGAVHTRFNHCIGAAYLATKVAKILSLTAEEQKQIVVAALLHDIGHGPFSHAFESIYGGDKIRHEKWNDKFLEEMSTNFTDNLELKELIKEARKILTEKNNFLHQIISSQLDVDRFDYLLRDSHFCGVSYGHFDVDWLISCMKRDDGKVVIVPKGVRAVEHYIMARRLMHHNVYFHKKNCSAIYLLGKFFEQLKKKIDVELLKSINSDFLMFVRLIKEKQEAGEGYFEENVIKDGFELYSRLTDHDVWILIKELAGRDDEVLKEISERFLSRDLPEVFHVKEEWHDYVREFIKDMPDKLGDEKWRFYYDSESKIKIFESDIDDSNVQEISIINGNITDQGSKELEPYCSILSYSDILRSFSDKKDRLSYIYYCKPKKFAASNKIHDEINEKIRELYNKGCFYNKPKLDSNE